MRPMAYFMSDVIEMVGIGRTTFYALVKSGEILVRKVGNGTIVLASDLDAWLESLASNDREARQ